MALIMTEQEIYDKVDMGSCSICEHSVVVPHRLPNDEIDITFDCTIEDIKQCPIVIHDMSL